MSALVPLQQGNEKRSEKAPTHTAKRWKFSMHFLVHKWNTLDYQGRETALNDERLSLSRQGKQAENFLMWGNSFRNLFEWKLPFDLNIDFLPFLLHYEAKTVKLKTQTRNKFPRWVLTLIFSSRTVLCSLLKHYHCIHFCCLLLWYFFFLLFLW